MAMAHNCNAEASGEAPNGDVAASEADVGEFINRLLASAAGLPRVCLLKRCRRRKRCLGEPDAGELPCRRHHQGMAAARFESALDVLGWPNRSEDGAPLTAGNKTPGKRRRGA